MTQGPFRRQASELRSLARELWRQTRVTVRRTPGLLMLSVLLAVMLWVFVTDEENPTRVGTFPTKIAVEAVNVGPQLAVANVLPAIDVRISAPEESWDRLTAANFRALVDLNGLSDREQQVPVRVEVNGVSGVRVLEALPSQVLVNLEDFVTRDVPVDTRLVGTLPRGYQLVEATPDRLTVSMSGPESLVELVEKAVADVNVTGLTTPISPSIELVARTAGGGEIRGVFLEPPVVQVDILVSQSTLHRSLPLDVEIGGAPAPGYEITDVEVQPAALTVEGTFEALQELDALTLSRVNVDGARESLRLTVPVTLPEGVSAVGEAEAEVVVQIEPSVGTVLRTVAPRIIDVPQGIRVTLDPDSQSVEVVLQGELPTLALIGPSDINVTASAAGFGIGEVDLPLTVTAPTGAVVVEVRPSQLSATLESP